MSNIILHEIFGREILSRNNISNMRDRITSDDIALDFSNISFVSRSVADEIWNLMDEYPSLTMKNIGNDVGKMLEVVKMGRASRGKSPNRVKRTTTIFCDTIDEVRQALTTNFS